MKKIFSKKIIIIALIVITCVVLSVFYFTKSDSEITYMTETVTKGDIKQVVNATGEVGPVQLVSVGAQVSGQIEKLYVSLGQTVKKGDLIAQIDSTTQENELKINKAKLESYNAQLSAAKVALKVAESQFEREKKLIEKNATSNENLENAEDTYEKAKSSVAELESAIIQTQISVNTGEVNLGYTRILSPLDGTIVSVPVEEGQTVNANQTTPTIAQIADLTVMEILMEISEGDITKVDTGMEVTYAVLSEPDKVYHTTLKSIDPGLTTLTNGTYTKSGSSDAAVYYYGRLVVKNTDGNLHIGMTTNNEIIVNSAKNVLTLPSQAIINKKGRSYVRMLDNGEIVEKEIETGISDNMKVEIVKGLSEGEKVILAQMSAREIADNSKANVRMRF